MKSKLSGLSQILLIRDGLKDSKSHSFLPTSTQTINRHEIPLVRGFSDTFIKFCILCGRSAYLSFSFVSYLSLANGSWAWPLPAQFHSVPSLLLFLLSGPSVVSFNGPAPSYSLSAYLIFRAASCRRNHGSLAYPLLPNKASSTSLKESPIACSTYVTQKRTRRWDPRCLVSPLGKPKEV